MVRRPRVVAFDVVETLMSLEPLRERFSAVGLAPELVERWFDRLLRDGMALSLAGDYAPFAELAAATLRVLARGEISTEQVEHVLAGIGELPAHPDAEPAMAELAGAGVSMVCLSNGAQATTSGFLDRSGLAGYIDEVISVEEVGSWKPPARVYEYALGRIGAAPAETALVAAHAFDCHGAKRVGMTTGWARRLEGHYAEVFAAPDVEGEDLLATARGLLALPAPQ